MTRRDEFLARIAKGPLVGDAAMGTAIYDHGIFINKCYDELCVTQPELIRGIHRAHVDAGAEVIETNSFGANHFRLARHGLESRVEELNVAAAEIARSVASDRVLVAGSIGPLGVPLEPIGRTGLDEARAAFRDQARALAAGGVDLFLLETFSSQSEILEALRACREAAPDLAVVALGTFDESGRTPLGTEAERMAEALQQEGADVIGANCSTGPGPLLDVLERMSKVSDGPFALYPNAGLPQVVEGRLLYLCSPQYLSKHVRRYVRTAPVAIVGGCCGTTESHVRLIRDAIRSVTPGRPTLVTTQVAGETTPAALPSTPLPERSSLGAKIAAGKFVVSVEVDAPRGTSAEKALEAVRTLAKGGVDAINIADGPRAQARMSNAALALLVRQELDLSVILHFCCRDRNLLGMQGDLIGAHALGLHDILCVTGDPPRMGDYPQATAVFDVDSIGLVQLVNRLNHGLDAAGNAIGERTSLVIGVGANPAAINLEEEVRRFELKVEAGAEFCMTQPVYDVELLHRFVEATRHCRIPTLVGILPLASFRNAEFLHEEVPGMSVPLEIRERMRKAGTGDSARREGVAIARESLEACRSLVEGVYVMPPLGRVRSALEVVEILGS
jgi:methionine synthase I (cobalamin-dependent)/5,10-methylenetetrahydrofolate reductase